MLHKEIPFLRIGLPLCAGIISGLYIKPDTLFLSAIVITVITGFIISRFYNKYQRNILFGLTFTLSLFIIGLLLYSNEKKSFSDLKQESSVFICTLSDYPEEKANSYLLKIKLNSKISTEGTTPVKGSILIYNRKDSSIASLLPGDILIIKCMPLQITDKGNPYEFDYKFFMENHGFRYYAFSSGEDVSLVKSPKKRKLIHRALITREKIIGMYKARGINDEKLAIVSAVILGEKSRLDQDQKQNFIKAGVMHIMAVSGLHAVILSMFVFSMLFFLKGKYNIFRVLITILILWSFAFITGLTPSVLRATMMFTFIQAGTLMKRRVNGINSVLASAFVLILIRPSVIFDAGFMLSYSAVIYIISFYQALYNKVNFKNKLADKIWQSAVVTIIAQAGTLPITIMLFNRFPVYFIVTNILIVPLASLLIISGCMVPLSYPFHFVSFFVAKILNILTGLTEELTGFISSLPGSSLENIGMTNVECIFLTVTIFTVTYYLLNRQRISAIYPVVCILLLVSTGTIREVSTKRSNEIIVYNTPGLTTIGIRTGKILNVYSDTSFIRPEVQKHSSTLGLKIKSFDINGNFIYCNAGKKILISNSIDDKLMEPYQPDIVILTSIKPDYNSYSNRGHVPQAIILSSEVANGYRFPLRKGIPIADTVHYVRKSGAFIKRI